jgi:hypothetical protein
VRAEELSIDDLKAALLRDRLASYVRLSGGYPIPVAGALYWLALGIAGYFVTPAIWMPLAFFFSGAIFPIALLVAKLTGNPFMKDKAAATNVIWPAFIGMLLFWVFIVAAMRVAPGMIPLLLAVGMSAHWPVIGWAYGRTALFSAHSILRALIALFIWLQFPEHHFTWLPLSVAFVYMITVVAIIIDSRAVGKKLAMQA